MLEICGAVSIIVAVTYLVFKAMCWFDQMIELREHIQWRIENLELRADLLENKIGKKK